MPWYFQLRHVCERCAWNVIDSRIYSIFNGKVEKQCQGEGYTLTTRDDGEPICYYYIDDVESDGDKYLDYYQSKARCEQRGKKSGITTRVCR